MPYDMSPRKKARFYINVKRALHKQPPQDHFCYGSFVTHRRNKIVSTNCLRKIKIFCQLKKLRNELLDIKSAMPSELITSLSSLVRTSKSRFCSPEHTPPSRYHLASDMNTNCVIYYARNMPHFLSC